MTDLDLTAIAEERDRIRSTYLRAPGRPVHRPRPAGCTTSRSCARTSTGRFGSTRRCSSSLSPRSSRTGTMRGRTTSSSTSGTETSWRSSTCPARPRPLRRSTGRPAPPGDLRGPGALGAAQATTRGGRRGVPGGERNLDLLPRPRRSTPRAHRRPARGDVRHRRPLTVRRQPVRARCRSGCVTTSGRAGPGRPGWGSRRAARSKSLTRESFTPKTLSVESSSSPRTKMWVTSVRHTGGGHHEVQVRGPHR